eukprot:m.106600 g.106600  ORF g.106600 m.106600 type:complete len:68 (-) comp8951_c0_seq4:1057-1260(-)
MADDDEDNYNRALNHSGCKTEHLALLDCFYEHKDWRKCKEVQDALKACMARPRPHIAPPPRAQPEKK